MQRKEFSYRIGGKKYFQRPLVLGQVIQLSEVLGSLQELPRTKEPLDWVRALGGRAAEALAVVLIPDGTALKDKDVAVLAEELRWAVDAPTTLRVVRDFFDFSPSSECAALIEEIAGHLEKLLGPASGSSSPTSPEGTPSAGGRSSGASPSQN